MTSESNEQFHYSQSLEATLTRYFMDTYPSFDRITTESARDTVYSQSLNSLYDLVAKLEHDPIKADEILRDILPPPFDETNDLDVELWLTKFRLAPVALIRRGDVPIDSEEVNVKFFDDLFRLTLVYSTGHGAQCATVNGCQHELGTHHEDCPVRALAIALTDEIRLLYFKLHGEYSAYSLANRLRFIQNRIEELGELFVKHGIASHDRVQASLLEAEDKAIVYASQVNGLNSFDDLQGE